MNNLTSIYQNSIRPCVVAFTSKYVSSDKPPLFPQIIGTGFVVREDGVIATNAHVVKAFKHVFRPPNASPDDWAVQALLFHLTERGMVEVMLDVVGAFTLSKFVSGSAYYGPKEGPDIAFVHIKAKGLPTLKINSETQLQEGMDVCTAGFPMGTDALTAPGWVHQVTPTLQKGIVSAVLPFTSKTPHAFSINVMTQGGASGFPVFLPDKGEVIGALYAGLNDIDVTSDHKTLYRVPTAISYVVPSHYIASALKGLEGNANIPTFKDAMTIEQMLQTHELHNVLDGGRNWIQMSVEGDSDDAKVTPVYRKLNVDKSDL